MSSKKIKLNLNYNKQLILETLSNEHRLLYNFLLERVKDNLDFKQINENYKIFRSTNNLTINSKSAQNTSINLVNNIKSYLSLKKKDKTARFPNKFKSHKFFNSFMLDYNGGCGGFKINNNKLELNLNSVKNKLVLDLPEYSNDVNNENVKTITFKKEDNDYYLIFVYQEKSKLRILNKNNYLSLDLGYSRLLTGTTKDENIVLDNLKQKKLNNYISELQSKRDSYKKGSRKWSKTNLSLKKKKRKLKNKVNDFIHKSSKKVVDYCISKDIGKLIVGNIEVKKVIKKENKKINGLSKSTGNLGRFKTFLEYKSKNVGIEFVLVNEAWTSKTNCMTGMVEFNSDLKNRYFEYGYLLIDRDINSSINILKRSGECLTQDSIKSLLLNKMSELKVY